MKKATPKKPIESAAAIATPKAAEPGEPNPFQFLALAEQVRLALPFAQQMIEEGINVGTRGDGILPDFVGELLNDPACPKVFEEGTDEEAALLSNRLEAAQAIGIAIGLCLSPAAFGLGGAR